VEVWIPHSVAERERETELKKINIIVPAAARFAYGLKGGGGEEGGGDNS